ncbi:T9SS type A sorting domain-containing protein [Dyadobacter sp. NIV53]|uniref:T9SS type A sorting domain-containing protein n=1 Tax=Dyadobacter sp. NIV53 TaxID=2861765 RepID=UPI001E4F406B|nr:T9SS type A sorting domain-containing protein [Dyadobacter sp. NIV53]
MEWHIYPNPSAGIFNVVFQANVNQEINVKVYDLTGRLYFESKVAANGFLQKHQVDLSKSAFSSGLYLIEVSAGLEKQTFKVIKN